MGLTTKTFVIDYNIFKYVLIQKVPHSVTTRYVLGGKGSHIRIFIVPHTAVSGKIQMKASGKQFFLTEHLFWFCSFRNQINKNMPDQCLSIKVEYTTVRTDLRHNPLDQLWNNILRLDQIIWKLKYFLNRKLFD